MADVVNSALLEQRHMEKKLLPEFYSQQPEVFSLQHLTTPDAKQRYLSPTHCQVLMF